MAKKLDQNLVEEFLKRTEILFPGDNWREYFKKRIGWLVTLTDGTIFCIEKPSIETRFCFGEHTYDFDEQCEAAAEARRNENLFRVRNLRRIDEIISQMKGDGDWADNGLMFWISIHNGWTEYLNAGHEWQWELAPKGAVKLGEEDIKRLIEGYEIVRERFDKRITAYLKRYGLSKVHSWVYWADE